ncbi:DUF4192 family protein [Kitasatospora sp. HPMI-4]|uniref:DUF4192 domain-containing protein n=1 Tax=Kitasatospora sp. HPMI-4 TaxID=3448443 RepID=UPI003F1D8A20
MNEDTTPTEPSGRVPGHLPTQLPVRLRGPADMAEMLPYLLGFFPDDSIVAVGLRGPYLQQGGVIRLDIPDTPAQWQSMATETARLLVELSEERDRRPEQVLLYLCRDPADGDGRGVLAELGPLAGYLAQAFGEQGVVVKESLCVSAGRWWSFLCAGTGCCDPEGVPVRPPGTASPAAAAATFAGLAPRGSRKSIIASLAPIGAPDDEPQRVAIERAGPQLLDELTAPGGRQAAVARTVELLDESMAEFQAGAHEITPERAARLLVGLQDKLGRDRAAEYAEAEELGSAQRLWRFLVQRCVPPFEHLAAAPLTLLAWTSWLADDSATARVVLARTLDLNPEYTLAQLLYESLNSGLLPDQLLGSVRQERAVRRDSAPPSEDPPAAGSPGPETPVDDAHIDAHIDEAAVAGAPITEPPLLGPPGNARAGHRLPEEQNTEVPAADAADGAPQVEDGAPPAEKDVSALPGPGWALPAGASGETPPAAGEGRGTHEVHGPEAGSGPPDGAADPGERRCVDRSSLRSQVRQAGRRLSGRLRAAGPGAAARRASVPRCGGASRHRAPSRIGKPV